MYQINPNSGPYNGAGVISRTQFQPYMTTPPFSEYPSGHSTWSGAASVVLRNFFGGNDTFRGDSVTIVRLMNLRSNLIFL
jgi:membrane-associated phospholipid phosphatase